jgi:hypothetical protein
MLIKFKLCLVTEWPLVAFKLYPSGRQSHANCTPVAEMQISIDFIHVACDWRPLGYNLFATRCQSHINFVCTSSQFFASTYS